MTKDKIYNPSKSIIDNSNINESEFQAMYEKSIESPDDFWASQAQSYLDWDTKWTEVKKQISITERFPGSQEEN